MHTVLYAVYHMTRQIVGMLRSTVHITKHNAEEIANTMNLLRTCIKNSSHSSFERENEGLRDGVLFVLDEFSDRCQFSLE